MKRFICVVLALISLFITACAAGGNDSSEVSESSETSKSDIVFSYPVPSSKEDSFSVDAISSEDGSSEDAVSPDQSSEDEASVSSEPSSAEASVYVPPISSPDISVPASEYGTPWVNDLRDQQDTDYHGYPAEELDAYFNDALFVGDSVSNGLKLYTSMYEKVFQGMVFNTGACYGYHNCLSAVSDKSMHPIYQGQKRTIWEMVALVKPKKVFIGFGLNDFGCTTTSSVKKCLDRIIANIYAVDPNVDIIILSSGYFTKEGESYIPEKNDYRTCFRQRDYNQFVLEYCNAVGLDYIDVSNCFADDYGYLPKESSLDNYCHPQIKLYSKWRDILYGYAADKLLGAYQNPPRMR